MTTWDQGRYGRHQGFAEITFDPRLSGGSVWPM